MQRILECVRVAARLALVSASLALAALGQAPRNSVTIPNSTPLVETRPASALVQTVREIDDPHNGDRWLLERGAGAPGGPGRLVRAGTVSDASQPAFSRVAAHRASTETNPSPELPVIRPGDRLVIEESTPVVEARLAAVALGTAFPGSILNARLEIGGKVVRAKALGAGRAELAPSPIGDQP
jgi:hypothetical protein